MAAVGFGVCSQSAVSGGNIVTWEFKSGGGKGKVVAEWWGLGI